MISPKNNLEERLFNFAVRCIKFLRTMPSASEFNVIKYQLTKSATSSGANYEEAQAGSSKADFKNKVRISLKEARESNYWLRVLKSIQEHNDDELDFLIQESNEIKKILASILNKLTLNN